jgi:hypothetical protein
MSYNNYMAITIKVKGDESTDFNMFSNIAEEFFGKSESVNNFTMIVNFQNNSYAQSYVKAIDPYFLTKSGTLT